MIARGCITALVPLVGLISGVRYRPRGSSVFEALQRGD